MDRAEIKAALAATDLDVPPEAMEELEVWARALQKLVNAYNEETPVVFDVAEVRVLTETMHQMLEELGIR